MPDVFKHINASQNEYPHLSQTSVDLETRPSTRQFLKARTRLVQQSSTLDLIWKLVQKLQNIEDIFYVALDPIPSRSLQMLHSTKPHCRLHLHGLVLKNHLTGEVLLGSLDHRNTLTSPLLHSVMISDDGFNEMDYKLLPNKQVEVSVFPHGAEMIEALRQAPNLSHVYICRTRKHRERPFRLLKNLPRWSESGPLRELHLDDAWEIRTQTLYEWRNRLDFSHLEVLRLHKPLDNSGVDDFYTYLEYFANLVYTDRSFPSLKVFELPVECITRLDLVATDFCCIISECIEGLPSLRELILEGWGKMIPLQPIVHAHGSTLRKLSLKHDGRANTIYCLSESDINLIADNCPVLKELSCKIRRSQGNSSEVAAYRALGRITRLRYLSLYLAISYCHCSDDTIGSVINARSHLPVRGRLGSGHHWTPKDGCEECERDSYARNRLECRIYDFQQSSEDPHTCCNGDIKQLMIDSALDKDLACAIFREIATSKPNESRRLDVMDIRVEGLEINGLDEICVFPIVWRVEPRLQSGAPIEVIAWETNCTDEMLAKRQKPLCSEWERAFKSLWPDDGLDAEPHLRRAPASGDLRSDLESLELRSSSEDCEHGDPNWWTKWSSFPLQLSPN